MVRGDGGMTDNLRERIARAIEISIQNARTAPGSWGFYIPEADAVLAEMRKDAGPVEADNSILGLYRFDTEKDRARAAEALSVQRFRASIAHPPVPPVDAREPTTSGVDDRGEKPCLHHPRCSFPRGGGGCDMDCARDYPQPETTYATCQKIGMAYGRASHRAILNGTGKQQCERCATWIDDNHNECSPPTFASTTAGDKDRENPVARPSEPFAWVDGIEWHKPAHRSVMANVKLGSWMSAALDDPNVCDAMKADIREWFSAGEPMETLCAALAAYREKRNADR